MNFPSLFQRQLSVSTDRRKPRRRKQLTELELLQNYRAMLAGLGISTEAEYLDLENDFYWLFRLEELIARAYRTFETINHQYFSDSLPKPNIVYCNRASGGFYDRSKHVIGISLAMTVEFGESEFFETLLHEIVHITIPSHSGLFYATLRKIGGTGRKAPVTILLQAKRKKYLETHYPVIVECPVCGVQQRYKTRRALRYACKPCCTRFAGGKFDARFQFQEVRT